MCAYCNRWDNCSIWGSGEFLVAVASPLEFEIDSGKSIEKHLSRESKSIHTNNCDVFQRGRPVDLLKLVFLFQHADGLTVKQKFRFSHTSGGRPLSTSSSLFSSSSSYSFTFFLPFPQSFDKSADKRDSVLISGHPPLLEVSTFFIIYY